MCAQKGCSYVTTECAWRVCCRCGSLADDDLYESEAAACSSSFPATQAVSRMALDDLQTQTTGLSTLVVPDRRLDRQYRRVASETLDADDARSASDTTWRYTAPVVPRPNPVRVMDDGTLVLMDEKALDKEWEEEKKKAGLLKAKESALASVSWDQLVAMQARDAASLPGLAVDLPQPAAQTSSLPAPPIKKQKAKKRNRTQFKSKPLKRLAAAKRKLDLTDAEPSRRRKKAKTDTAPEDAKQPSQPKPALSLFALARQQARPRAEVVLQNGLARAANVCEVAAPALVDTARQIIAEVVTKRAAVVADNKANGRPTERILYDINRYSAAAASVAAQQQGVYVSPKQLCPTLKPQQLAKTEKKIRDTLQLPAESIWDTVLRAAKTLAERIERDLLKDDIVALVKQLQRSKISTDFLPAYAASALIYIACHRGVRNDRKVTQRFLANACEQRAATIGDYVRTFEQALGAPVLDSSKRARKQTAAF